MAKTGVFDADLAARAARATELKKELQRLVRVIADEEECSVEVIDHAREALLALRELRARRRSSFSLRTLACPEEYRCPISKELMRDPVIVATGQVRAFALSPVEFRLFHSFDFSGDWLLCFGLRFFGISLCGERSEENVASGFEFASWMLVLESPELLNRFDGDVFLSAEFPIPSLFPSFCRRRKLLMEVSSGGLFYVMGDSFSCFRAS